MESELCAARAWLVELLRRCGDWLLRRFIRGREREYRRLGRLPRSAGRGVGLSALDLAADPRLASVALKRIGRYRQIGVGNLAIS